VLTLSASNSDTERPLALKHKDDLAVLAWLDGVQFMKALPLTPSASRCNCLPPRPRSNPRCRVCRPTGAVVSHSASLGSRLASLCRAPKRRCMPLAMVLGIRLSFDESDPYENLTWLCSAPAADRAPAVRPPGAPNASRSCSVPLRTSLAIRWARTTPWALAATTAMARKVRNISSSACCATKRVVQSRRKCSAVICITPEQ